MGADIDGPLPCSPTSILQRGCAVRIARVRCAPFGVKIDVLSITNLLSVFDLDDQPVDLRKVENGEFLFNTNNQQSRLPFDADANKSVADDSWWSYVPGWGLFGGNAEAEESSVPLDPTANHDSPQPTAEASKQES